MTPGEILDQIRALYCDAFATVVADCSTDRTVVSEAVYLSEDGSLNVEGNFSLPARADVFVFADGSVEEAIQVDTERMISFAPVSFEWEKGLHVTLAPFQWNWCELSVTGSSLDVTHLVSWFESWFKKEIESASGEPISAVHFMSDPEVSERTISTEIDLGTAPVEAIEALLDACKSAGATSVTLGSEP